MPAWEVADRDHSKMGCSHNRWLGLRSQGTEILLDRTDRLQALVDQLSDPASSYPCLLVLIGSKKKTRVLKEIIPSAKKGCISEKKQKRPIQLLLDPGSLFKERPLLYADCPLPAQVSGNTACESKGCPDVVSRTLPHGMSDTIHHIAENVYSQLLGTFSDVVCLFYEDFDDGLNSISGFLLSWMENRRQAAGTANFYPSLLLVVEKERPETYIETDIKAELLGSLARKTALSLFDYFSDVDVVSVIQNDRLSSAARLRRLKDRLLVATKQATVRRKNARMLFSGTHFPVLFDYACDQFIATTQMPFDFIAASRLRNPVSSTWETHVLQLLRQFPSTQDLIRVAVPVISSALLQDAYPRDMHLFNASEVFSTLYRDILLTVARKGSQEQSIHSPNLSPLKLVQLIENQFVLRSQENTDTSTKTSAAAHRRVLKEFQPYLQDIHTLCSMICLQRPPEHKLPCGHAVCDTCIQIHHESSGHDPWSFELEECPLCKSTFTPRVTVKMHNPARGFRVLCLDGGGCRGIIPLKFLQALEDRIDLPLPVQQNFDIFVAPSSGALSILTMVLRGVRIDDAIEIFGNLAKEAFEPRQLPLLSLPLLAVLTVLMQTVVSLLTGCKYPTKGIEIAVKKVFTEDLTMSDCSHATEIGAKIAVLVTEVVGCKPFLFTNYHGKQRRKSDCGYRVVEISGNESDPRVWEIARCTSAAPWYFKPQSIASLGAFQDGGLWMNDPTALVDSEIKVIASEEEEPLVVSLGTGSVNVDRPASPSVSRRAWKNGLIYRFFEALMSSIGSKRYWRSDNNYYRFNVKFDHEEPKLDDTQQIPAMASRADEQFRSSGQLDELAFRLIAAHFHFELEDLPRRVGDRFAGVGHILCDLKKGHPAYDALVNHLTRSGAKFYLNGSPIAGNMADRAFKDSTGNVRQRVEFMIAHETLSIQLKVRQSDPQQISGSPFCIAKRIRDQNLDSFFGQANHRKRKHSAQDGSGKSNKRQKIHQ